MWAYTYMTIWRDYYYYYLFIFINYYLLLIENDRSGHYSGQLSRMKKSWSNTLLNRCTRIDRRWNKKAVSRSSPDSWVIFFARWLIDRAERFNSDWLEVKSAVRAVYLFTFLTAACSATDLASLAAEATYELARGQTTVTSQLRFSALPRDQSEPIRAFSVWST